MTQTYVSNAMPCEPRSPKPAGRTVPGIVPRRRLEDAPGGSGNAAPPGLRPLDDSPIRLLIAAFTVLVLSMQPARAADAVGSGDASRVVAGTRTFLVELPDTLDARRKGLMGRTGLAPNRGMLFLNDAAGFHAMWMKNMRFALDLVWLSRDGEVIDVQTVPPCAADPCPVYTPRRPAWHVLEVAAGRFPAAVGDMVELRLTP